MALEAITGRSTGLYAAIAASLLVAAALGAALLASHKNALVTPHLGAEFRAPTGEPVPLDEPLDSRL